MDELTYARRACTTLPHDARAHAAFLATAAARGADVALEHGDATTTYARLARGAAGVAARLGAGAGVAGVLCDRSPDAYAAIYGVLLSGRA